jgi:hypothetical protein
MKNKGFLIIQTVIMKTDLIYFAAGAGTGAGIGKAMRASNFH